VEVKIQAVSPVSMAGFMTTFRFFLHLAEKQCPVSSMKQRVGRDSPHAPRQAKSMPNPETHSTGASKELI
jgi:hypothetical protein